MSAWSGQYGTPSGYRANRNMRANEDARRQLTIMPRYDTRSLTGRIMGDPEPTDRRIATMRRLMEMEGAEA